MATKVIKSSSNQPIYVNLPGSRSVKIPARQTVEVEEADLKSPEIMFYRNRGSVVVVEKAPAKAKGSAGEKTKPTQRKRGEDEIVDEKGGK